MRASLALDSLAGCRGKRRSNSCAARTLMGAVALKREEHEKHDGTWAKKQKEIKTGIESRTSVGMHSTIQPQQKGEQGRKPNVDFRGHLI